MQRIAGEISTTAPEQDADESEHKKHDKFNSFRRFILNLCFHKRDTPAENIELLEEIVPLFEAMKSVYSNPEQPNPRKKVKKGQSEETKRAESQFHKVLIDLMISILTKAESSHTSASI